MKFIQMTPEEFEGLAYKKLKELNPSTLFLRVFKTTNLKEVTRMGIYMAETEEEAAMMAEENWKP